MSGLQRNFSDDLQPGIRGGGASATVRPMPASDLQEVFFHFDFLRALQMHKRLAAGIFSVAVLLAIALVAKGWNNYVAETQIYVQPAPKGLLEHGQESHWPYDANTYESYIAQQVHNVTRPDVLAAAIPKIPGFARSGEGEQAAVSRLNRALDVTRVGNGYEVSVKAKAKSAARAADIANAVSNSYIASATREQRAGDTERIELLREERDRVLKELAADRAEQEDLNKKLGVAAISTATADPIDEQISAIRAELVKARTESDEAAARLMALNKGGATNSAPMNAEADEIVAADPGMVSMKTALNARRSALITQMANLTPNHPQYKQDAEELAQINSSLDSMTKDLRAKAAAHIQQKLKNDLERTEGVEAKLNGQLAQLTSAAGTAAPRLQRSNELATDIQRLQNRFTVVDEQFRNLTIENNAPGAVYMANAAVAPLGAERTAAMRNGIVVLLVGLVFAVGAALVAHNLDQRIYIAADVERVLGFAPMAQLPDFLEVGSGVAEEYMLRLAAAIEHAHQDGALKSCIFTGVAQGAGATTVATRVTSMLDAMGRETVFVDASGSPPSPALGTGGGTTELVPSARGSRSTALLQQMERETDEETIVLTDAAPLLVSGETEYMARFIDSAIVVIESGVTTRAQLRSVAQTLQRLKVSAVGFVLNRIPIEKADPAFRESVRAVEAHLAAQARAFSGRVEKEETAAHTTHEQHGVQEKWRQADTRPQAKSAAPPEPFTQLDQDGQDMRAQQDTRAPRGSAAPEAAVANSEPVASPVRPRPPVGKTTPRSAASPDVASLGGEPDVEAEAAQAPAAPPKPTAAQVTDWFAPAPTRGRPNGRSAHPTTPPEPRVAPPAAPSQPAPPPPAAPMQAAAETQAAAEKQAAAQPESAIPSAPAMPPTAAAPSVPAARTEPAAPAARAVQPARTSEPAPAASPEAAFAPASAPTPASAPAPAPKAAYEAPPRQPAYRAPAPATPRPEAGPHVPATEPQRQAATDTATLPSTSGPEGELQEIPYSAASRLSGLRNLLVSLGLHSLHKHAEQREGARQAEARPERAAERVERPVYAEPYHASASASKPAEPTVPPTSVVAQPEFLPPQSMTETTEREPEKEPRPSSMPRKNRWDSEDVDTLPSWRGQYRKKR